MGAPRAFGSTLVVGRIVVAAVLGLSASVTPNASAEPSAAAVAKARGQFQQALALETAGDYGGALTLLREVSAIRMTPQVRFHIATCEEALGKLIAAVGDFQLALGDAQDTKAEDVVQEATTRLAAAKARLAKVTIKRGKGAETAQISLDGVSLGAASIGVEIPVDPGPHSIEARTPGAPPFTKQVDVVEKDRKTVEIEIAKPTAPVASASVAPIEPPPPAPSEEPKPSLVPYVVGGVGVASLAASGVFFLLRSGAVKDLDAACGPNRDACPSSSKSTFDSGKTYTLLGDVTLAVGVVGVGVGVGMLLLAKKAPEPAAAVRIVPAAPSSLAGASLVGRF